MEVMLECELQWMWIHYRVSALSAAVFADETVPLKLVIQHDIAPLANNKQYTRSLSKVEVRATYSVRRHWPDLCPHTKDIDVQV
jgi:hypothetical protein